ncbi:hypothetical protein ACIUXF_07590 [Pseudomonas aeruginosa]
MSEVHRFSVVKMLSKAGNKISYDPHGPEPEEVIEELRALLNEEKEHE